MNELDEFCPPPRLTASPRQVERVSCSTWMRVCITANGKDTFAEDLHKLVIQLKLHDGGHECGDAGSRGMVDRFPPPRKEGRFQVPRITDSGRQRPQPFRSGPSEGRQRWLT